MKRRAILALRLMLAAVFLYAAWTKLKQPWLVFAMSIDTYQLLPEWAVLTLARTLPWVELGVGVLLLAGVWIRYTSAAAAALLAVFFGIMLVSYGKGMGIDCGCFGLGEALTAKTLARDGALLAAAVVLCALTVRGRLKPAAG
jgi:uncharacterized membrane protein YphA (DoxX/SURF4 family)